MKRKNAKSQNKTYIPNDKKLNQKLKNDIYNDNEEHSEYEISSTYRNNKSPGQNNSMNKETYIEQLESKIQQQAKQISELNKYKFLCEKRIRQLNPDEILPLTLESLNDENNLFIINNNNRNNKNLNNKDINKKYELLNEKFQKLLNDYNEIIRNNNMHDISSTTINAGNINDKYKILKEKYKKIKEENKKILKDNEQNNIDIDEEEKEKINKENE